MQRQRQLLKAAVEEAENQRQRYRYLRKLAYEQAVHNDLSVVQARAADKHQQLLAAQQRYRLPGDDAANQQGKEHRKHHQLIRQRIHQLAEIRNALHAPRQEAIQHIGGAGQQECAQRPIIQRIPKHQHPVYGHQNQADQGQYIGDRPEPAFAVGHVAFSFFFR